MSNPNRVNNSPAKSKPPPAPTVHSSAINSPVNQLDTDPRHASRSNNNNKLDSMNSSFADSIENNMDNRPATAMVTESNTNTYLNNVLNNIQPIKGTDLKQNNSKENSAAPSEAEDSWLNALISNKKTVVEPKKPSHQVSDLKKSFF